MTWLNTDGVHDVEACSGAFLLIRREALEAVGGWDERYWFYAEDLDLCLRVTQAGWRVRYVGTATALHLKSSSSHVRRREDELTMPERARLAAACRRAIVDSHQRFYRQHLQADDGAAAAAAGGRMFALQRRAAGARPMSERQTPAATISLVTWNGLRWLPGCLDSVAAQTLADYELLILDNGSDGRQRRVAAGSEPPATTTHRARRVGREPGLRARRTTATSTRARGEAVLLLNQDVELDPGFLAAAVAALAARPRCRLAVQALVRRLEAPAVRSDVVDTTGLVMHRDRRVVSRDQLRRWTATSAPRGAGVGRRRRGAGLSPRRR